MTPTFWQEILHLRAAVGKTTWLNHSRSFPTAPLMSGDDIKRYERSCKSHIPKVPRCFWKNKKSVDEKAFFNDLIICAAHISGNVLYWLRAVRCAIIVRVFHKLGCSLNNLDLRIERFNLFWFFFLTEILQDQIHETSKNGIERMGTLY